MLTYQIYNEENGPEYAKETLKGYTKKYGFIPNVMGVAAESQAALETYTDAVAVLEKSTFTAGELQALYLTVSYENGCEYCVAAHTTVGQMVDLDQATLSNLRDGKDVDDSKLNELVKFARLIVRNRGVVNAEEVDEFINAGYTKGNIFDVITLVATKTISNYINHIVKTPVDDAFSKNAWVK
jgi:AhpD family alkylhydroperoxidase